LPGSTRHLGLDPNSFEWSIPQDRALSFESFIFRYVRDRLATKSGRIKVIATPRTGDQGRDIEIRHSDPFHLFGATIAPAPEGNESVVFVECKSTQKAHLDDSFLIDASQHADHACSHYVLVTNATITPYCHYRAENEWRRRGSEFILIDRRRLYDALRGDGTLEAAARSGLLSAPASTLPPLTHDGVAISWQVERDRKATAREGFIYLTLRNFTSESQLTSMGLASDHSWTSDVQSIERALEPGRDATFLVRFAQQTFEPLSELGLYLTSDGRSQRITIPTAKHEFAFEPPFVGDAQRAIQSQLRGWVEEESQFALISVQGEAGVGKSRTIRSALQPLKGGRYDLFSFECDPRTGAFDLTDLFEEMEASGTVTEGLDHRSLRDAVTAADRASASVLLVLEDLHHADPSVIAMVKTLVTDPPACHTPVVVVVSGRDDHTFPNTDYFSLLALVRTAPHERCRAVSVPPLSDDDALTLVRAVAVDLPEFAVDRICRLGQNNPFIIIECLQYLLDLGIARILSRQTIGVLDPERFAGLSVLPDTVEELYAQRLASLRAAPEGELAFQFLCIASFFGPIIHDGIFKGFFDGSDSDRMEDLLIARRFLGLTTKKQDLRFAHENLYHFMRRWCRQPSNAPYAAASMLGSPALMARLTPLARGEVWSMAKQFQKAFAALRVVWNRVQDITNFSSEEVDKTYYEFLPALYETAVALDRPKQATAKIALVQGYMGVHNFPLLQGELACLRAEQMLEQLYPEPSQGLSHKLAIRQLRAHALQNMGRTTEAYRIMLELEAQINEGAKASPALRFDLYDRMQEYYRKINHAELMEHYSVLARRIANQTRDEKLLASHQITDAVCALFSGRQRALAKSQAAVSSGKRIGVRRFGVYNRLTQLVATAIYAQGNRDVFKQIFGEAEVILKYAAVESFSDSIIRLQLLLATCALFSFDDRSDAHRAARVYIDAGQESALRFGIGLYDWALDNLAAVVDLEEGVRDEEVRRRFRTCLERLKRRGLNHVGASSGTYPNAFAIANALRFFGRFSESSAVDALRSTVYAYESRFLYDERAALAIVRRASIGQAVFWPRRRTEALRYPAQDGYFVPIF
jgi:hypothetical protein